MFDFDHQAGRSKRHPYSHWPRWPLTTVDLKRAIARDALVHEHPVFENKQRGSSTKQKSSFTEYITCDCKSV